MFIVDIWSGDLHQNHAGTSRVETWEEASELMQNAAETGMLCNVLHADFLPPSARVEEQKEFMRQHLSKSA